MNLIDKLTPNIFQYGTPEYRKAWMLIEFVEKLSEANTEEEADLILRKYSYIKFK